MAGSLPGNEWYRLVSGFCYLRCREQVIKRERLGDETLLDSVADKSFQRGVHFFNGVRHRIFAQHLDFLFERLPIPH